MQRCANGHDCGWVLTCGQCAAPVNYREAFDELSSLPSVEPRFERISILSVGVPRFSTPSAYSAEVIIQETEEMSDRALALKRVPGGTWLDYFRASREAVRSWLRLACLERSKFRLAVVDTAQPHSVVVVDSLDPRTIIIAVIPNRDATPMEQNTSYVALKTAMRRGLPVIMATSRFVKELAVVAEGKGLATGQQALGHVLALLVGAMTAVEDLGVMDARLGVRLHSFSAVVAASRKVYPTLDSLFAVQEYENSLESFPRTIHTLHMISVASKDASGELVGAFERYCAGIPGLTSAKATTLEKDRASPLYDLLLIFGLDESVVEESLGDGYVSIAIRTGTLRAEEVAR